MTSAEVLRRYARDRDQPAFTQFVQQHFDFVYSAAARQAARDPHLARDIAQSVFLAAARHAASLSDHPSLLGWLYTTTRRQTAKHIQAQRRWQAREQKAHAMNDAPASHTPADELWQQLRPLLDDALHALNERDREAILLRYFEGNSHADIGAQLGLAENSARMRVDRALEKIRHHLSRHGLTSTAAALGTVLATHAVHAAPAGFAVQTAALICQSAAPATFISSLLFKLHLMNSLKLTTATAALFITAAGCGLLAATATTEPVVTSSTQQTFTRSESANTSSPTSIASTSAPAATAPVPPITTASSASTAVRPSNEFLFFRTDDKILLIEAFIKRFDLTQIEAAAIQTNIKRAWDELDAFAAQNATVQAPAPGKVVLTVVPFTQGADIYDRLLADIARTLGETRNREFLSTTASALEHNLKYCGASTRTFTITKAVDSQGTLMDYQVVDTWTSAYNRRGRGTKRYKTPEAFALDYPHLAKRLPADFR